MQKPLIGKNVSIKEKIDTIIFNRDILTLFAILSFLILLHHPIEALFNAVVVKYVFSEVFSAWYNDLIFTFSFILIFIFTLKKIGRYTPSVRLAIFWSFVLIVYSYYRFCSKSWDFTPFLIFHSLKYLDLLFAITLANLLLLIPFTKKDDTPASNTLFDDSPIDNQKPDILGYGSYAGLVSSKIRENHFTQSFAIGINGVWGSGKTSFIGLLKKNLIGNDIIEISFNPWNSVGPQSIIKDFFNSVQDKLKPHHSSISRVLIEYSNKLSELDDNKFSQAVKLSVSYITGLSSVDSSLEEINSLLKKINKKIVIYIDDLDRLDKSEVIEVIRLVRNTANFYNTFFIVAYDKDYVSKAVEEINSHNHELFLEKIFQIEVNLPYFNRDKLRYELFKKLKTIFPTKYHIDIEEAIIGTAVMQNLYLNDWLETMRDVTRFANALSLNMTKLLGEIDIKDFIKIELLRLKFPFVYELFFKKAFLFLKEVQSNNKNRYKLTLEIDHPEKREMRLIEHEGVPYSRTKDLEGTYLEKYLKDLKKFPDDSIKKILEIIGEIFIVNLVSFNNKNSHLSIIYPNKFYRYFAYGLLEGSLSEWEFEGSREAPLAEFNNKISNWLTQGLEVELKTRFIDIKRYDSREDFEKVIRAIFYLANHKVPGDNHKLVGYDGADIVEKLAYNRDINSKKFYTTLELKIFVLGLFENALIPFRFESELIYYICYRHFDDESFPLKLEELKRLSVGFLRAYCDSVNKLDAHVFNLLGNSSQVELVSADGGGFYRNNVIPSESRQVFKEFVKKDFDTFLHYLIQPKTNGLFGIKREVLNFFDNFEELKSFINNEDNIQSKYLSEFQEFFTKNDEVQFEKYISFDFKIIPISKAWNE